MYIGPWSALLAAAGQRLLIKHPNWIPGVVWVVSAAYSQQGMTTDQRAEYIAGMIKQMPIEG